MRSIWNGSISFGLVNVPVKLFGATEDHDIKAHQVHNKDGARIRYKRVCEECGEVVEFADIAKAYEHEGNLVVLSQEDLDAIGGEQGKTVEVVEFVPDGIDPLLYEKPYFIGPQNKDARKAYLLLFQTLLSTELVAIARFNLRGKTRLGVLRALPKEQVIALYALRWPDEIRSWDYDYSGVSVSEAELQVAAQLVEAMRTEFNADRYRDDYQEQLKELIAARASGEATGEVVIEQAAPDTEDISDLLAKLEASVDKKKKARRKKKGVGSSMMNTEHSRAMHRDDWGGNNA